MREVGIGKDEIAKRAKKNAIKLDGRLTEPNGGQTNGGQTNGSENGGQTNGGEKPKDEAR